MILVHGWTHVVKCHGFTPSLLWHSQAMNKTTAKKHVESVSRQYVNAKRSTAEYENITRGLIRGGTSTPLQGTPQETQQVWGERERERIGDRI